MIDPIHQVGTSLGPTHVTFDHNKDAADPIAAWFPIWRKSGNVAA